MCMFLFLSSSIEFCVTTFFVVSFCQEKSSLLVRLPVGSEVPYTGCTFRYIDTTGQTVEEVPGERLDSRTIETVTPGKLHTFHMIVMCLP